MRSNRSLWLCALLLLNTPAVGQTLPALHEGGLLPSVTSTYLPSTTATHAMACYVVKAVSGYAGPIMRVQANAGPNAGSQKDVYPSGVGAIPTAPDYPALDAWDGGVPPTVVTLYDQINSNNCTQSTIANAPILSMTYTSPTGVRPLAFNWVYRSAFNSGVPNTTTANLPFLNFTVSYSTQNFGVVVASDPRSAGDHYQVFEAYGAAVVTDMYGTGAGPIELLSLTPTGHLGRYPPARPTLQALAANSSGRIAYTVGVAGTAGTAGTLATFSGTSTIGFAHSGSNYSLYGDLYGFSLFTTTPGATDIGNMTTAVNAALGFKTSGYSYRLVYDGNSLESGWGTTGNNTPLKVMNFDSTWDTYVTAVGGALMSAQYTNRATRDVLLYNLTNYPGSPTKIVTVIIEPTNDIAAGSWTSAASAVAAADAMYTGTTVPYVAYLKAASTISRVVVPTTVSRTGFQYNTGNFQENYRLEYNAQVRAGAAANGYILDDRAQSACSGGTPFDTPPVQSLPYWFASDGIHVSDYGWQNCLAAGEKAAILAAAAS